MLDWFVLLTPLLLLPIVLLFVFVGCEFTVQGLTPPFGQPGDIPVPGDYYNEGVARAAVYRPSTGVWEIFKGDIFQSTTSETRPIPFPIPRMDGDVPVPGDYGAGHTELGVFRPSTAGVSAKWFIFDPVSNVARQFTFPVNTQAGDIPLPPGNYLGAGSVSVVVFRPSTAEWFFSDVNGNQSHQPVKIIGGHSDDKPVPGDYLGIGTTQMAVFQPSVGKWFVSPVGSNIITRLPADNFVPFNSASDTVLPPRLYLKPGPYPYAVGPAIYHSTDGTYELFDLNGEHIRLVNTIIPPPLSAMNGDLAAPGEYDGYGLTEAVIFRPAGGMWFKADFTVIGGY